MRASSRDSLTHSLLDERFNRLTRLAMYMFDVPLAVINLVNTDRHWFKSCSEYAINKGPVISSFYKYTHPNEELTLIPDTLLDRRFVHRDTFNKNQDIRFYASYPIRCPDGKKLAIFSIMDTRPRELDNNAIQALKDLAITAEREMAAYHLATTDELTMINNRRGFEKLASQELKLCRRHNIDASMIFFDLDNLKNINDRYGHAEGDHALITFVDQIRSNYRESDLIGRLGGDEFAMLMLDTSSEHSEQVVERIKSDLDGINASNRKDYDISFSYGAVHFDPERHDTVHDLLHESDRLMYQMKISRKANGFIKYAI